MLGMMLAIAMSIEHFLIQFGLPLIFFGAMFEGETVVITAGYLVHRGYLPFAGVVLAAGLGSLCADQFLFYLGWRHGWNYLERSSAMKTRVARVNPWLEKYGAWLILGFRYLYGVRTVIAMAFGASRYPWRKFFVLNAIGAITWSLITTILGYAFGHTIERLLGDIKRYEFWIFGALILIGAGVWLWRRHRER